MDQSYEYFDIACNSNKFDLIKDKPEFILILRLARVVNAISFPLITVYDLKEHRPSPSKRRQLVNSFLYTAGILYEGLDVAKSLGKYFKHIDQFKNGLGKLVSDRETKKLHDTVLYKIRNKTVFHFDNDIYSDVLKTLDYKTFIFATCCKSSPSELYFSLTDEIVINYLLSDYPDKENHEMYFKEIIATIADTAFKFKNHSEILIAKILAGMQWDIIKSDTF